MSLPLLIAIKRFHDSAYEFISQETLVGIATAKAEAEYIEKLYHSVDVFEVDKNALFPEDKIVSIFHISRTCKHNTLQRKFIFEKGCSEVMCEECKLHFRKEVLVEATV